MLRRSLFPDAPHMIVEGNGGPEFITEVSETGCGLARSWGGKGL